MATDASLLRWKGFPQGRARPGPTAHPSQRRGSPPAPVLSSWAHATVLEEVTSLPDPVATWKDLWNQLSEQQRESMNFKDDSATVTPDEPCFLFVLFNL